jgi:phage terminase small subunit
MSPKQQRFVEEYLIDLNATQAAIRAGYSQRTANEQGARLLVNVSVAAAVAKAKAERTARTEITQDMILQRWWEIATADPNELIQFRRTCCRYCHGSDHSYQWIDHDEFMEALAAAAKAELPLPSNDGGYGYDRKGDPHTDCPKCFGEGRADVHALDTRKLDSKARLLYAGAKVTRDGFEIKLQDQAKALENVARHLGMFTDKVEHDLSKAAAELITKAMSPKEAAERYRNELG